MSGEGGTAARFCPYCGTAAVAGAGYCPGCGRALPPIAPPPTPQAAPAAPIAEPAAIAPVAPMPTAPAATVAPPPTPQAAPAAPIAEPARPARRGGIGGTLALLGLAAAAGAAAFLATTAALGGGPLGPGVGSDLVRPSEAVAVAVTSPSTTPTVTPSSATPTPAPTPVGPTPGSTATPPPDRTPGPGGGMTAFSDDFSSPGAWPASDLEFLDTAYAEGRYRLTVRPTNFLLYSWSSVAGPDGGAILEATFRSEETDGRTVFGLATAGAGGSPAVAFVVSTDGRYALQADFTESVDTLLQGRTDAFRPGRANRLSMRLSPEMVTVYLNGERLGRAKLSTGATLFGVAVMSDADGAVVTVDDYRVWSVP